MKTTRVISYPLPAPSETITLEGISRADALVLHAISRNIAGDPNGPRGAADRLMRALETVGISVRDYTFRYTPDSGYITFADRQ